VRSVLPAIRAMLAQELVDGYGLRQERVAEILGLSQSAVSKYSRRVRGHVIKANDVQEVRPLINNIITLLMDGTYTREEFLDLFCRTCTTIRKSRLMCEFCQKSDPKVKIKDCNFCFSLRWQATSRK
jgi:predicted transcriptional regulator